MAFSLPLADLTSDEKSVIKLDFTVKKNVSQFNPNPDPRICFTINKSLGKVYLPLGKWNMFYEDFPYSRRDYPRTTVQFTKTLYTLETDPRGIRDQVTLVQEIKDQLKKRRTCLIAAHTGYGKTMCAIYLIAWSKMKTVVLVFSDLLQRQWKKEIEAATTAKVQLVKNSKDPIDPDADIYIIGVKRASAMDRRLFDGIGMVVIDEAHIATETGFCQTLLKFQPYYLLGATATPTRPDGLHKIFYLYFGSKKEFIVREETNKKFTVVKYQTRYQPEIDYMVVYGRLTMNWSKIQTSIAEIPERHSEIVKIILRHPDDKIMILSGRQVQSKAIYNLLIEAGESTELLIGRKKVKDLGKWRVLVAEMKKAGVGFDDPDLTMMVIITDVKDIRQYEGRIRTDDCLIYDIVDDFKTFETHWRQREKWYRKKGAKIEIQGTLRQDSQPIQSRRFLKLIKNE